MAYQRIICRTSLSFENLFYGFRISGITSESVYSFRRETYDFAVSDVLGGILDSLIVI